MAALILALLEEQDNGVQVRTCLEACGHEVIVVDSFTKALAVLNSEKIDLIISDVHLANGGTVFDFLRKVKKGQWTCKIPFVLFSFRPTPAAKYLADGIRTTSRHLGAIKYIEMETFDATQFQEQTNDLLWTKEYSVETEKTLKFKKISE
jgi:CheY-like chemotaxis protein